MFDLSLIDFVLFPVLEADRESYFLNIDPVLVIDADRLFEPIW